MSIKPAYANIELDTATIVDVRIVYADRIRHETTARKRGWRAEDAPTRAAGFLAWAAATRLGLVDLTYEEFVEQLVDVQLDDKRADSEGDDAGDPSQPAP